MSVVVDLGCQPQRIDCSIEPLVERFAPKVLLGFDPAATPPLNYNVQQTKVVIEQAAAWTHDGTVLFSARIGIEGTVMSESSAWSGDQRAVPCLDFSVWLAGIAPNPVVKMDIEGAELPVLEKIVADGTDERIGLLLVEWHDQFFDQSYGHRRAKVEAALRCPVEVWH